MGSGMGLAAEEDEDEMEFLTEAERCRTPSRFARTFLVERTRKIQAEGAVWLSPSACLVSGTP